MFTEVVFIQGVFRGYVACGARGGWATCSLTTVRYLARSGSLSALSALMKFTEWKGE